MAVTGPAGDNLPDLLRRSRALAEVAREVAGVGTPAEWGARAVAAVEQATGWSRVFLFRLSEPQRTLELLASRGISSDQVRESAVLDAAGPSLSAVAARQGSPVVSGQESISDEVRRNAARQGFAAYAVLPLVAHGQVLGTLSLMDTSARVVASEELDFLRAVADLLATGLDNARLYAIAQSREAQARFLTEVTDLFAGSLDPAVVLQTVVERCVGVLGDGCGIFLNPDGAQPGAPLNVAAVHHRHPEMIPRIAAMLEALPFRYGQGITGAVASSGQPLLLADLSDARLNLPEPSLERVRLVDATSCLIAPLRTSRRVLGILVCISTPEPDARLAARPQFGAPAGGPLTQAELELALEVCHRAAAALENADLYSVAESARLRLHSIFSQMVDGVLVLDRGGCVVARNAAAERLIGSPIPEGVSVDARPDLFDVRRPDGSPMPPEERPSSQVLTTGAPVQNLPLMVVQPGGQQIELSASASPLVDDAGRVVGAVTVLRDVTELRRLERAKDSFLSVASHELRTPLTPLKGLTQILLRHLERNAGSLLDVARVERYLRTMDGQVDRLTGLVNDLLDVSRIRTGRMALRPELVDLVALVRAVLERFTAIAPVEIVEPQGTASQRDGEDCSGPASGQGSGTGPGPETATEIGARQIRFEPRVSSLTGMWDPARLEQVVTNLVANSIKYSPAGGQIIVAVARRAGQAPGADRVQDAEDAGAGAGSGDVAHLWVRDPGIGLPPTQIAELFQPFARLGNAPAESFGGMGLGLYISRDIVERHGGRIWAQSDGAGLGSVFHVELPI